MGKIWAHDLPDVLRDHGVEVEVYPGYFTRSRSSGGLEEMLGVVGHHDAVPPHIPTHRRLSYAWEEAAISPIGNGWILRDGTAVLGAAGAANTQGKSYQAHRMSKGWVPRSKGNLYLFGWESECDGVGQIFTKDMCDAFVRVIAATQEWGECATSDFMNHHTYAGSRKIDCKGHTEGYDWANGYEQWEDLEVIKSVEQYLIERNNIMIPIPSHRRRLIDTRPGYEALSSMGYGAYMQSTVPRHPDIPQGASMATVHITIANSTSDGYVVAWPNGERPNSSNLNFTDGVNISNTTLVELAPDGSFDLVVAGHADVIIDVLAWQR